MSKQLTNRPVGVINVSEVVSVKMCARNESYVLATNGAMLVVLITFRR